MNGKQVPEYRVFALAWLCPRTLYSCHSMHKYNSFFPWTLGGQRRQKVMGTGSWELGPGNWDWDKDIDLCQARAALHIRLLAFVALYKIRLTFAAATMDAIKVKIHHH